MAPRPDDLPVPPRQTLFFSATWPKEVQAIARQLCRNDPVQVFVGNVQVGDAASQCVMFDSVVSLAHLHVDRKHVQPRLLLLAI